MAESSWALGLVGPGRSLRPLYRRRRSIKGGAQYRACIVRPKPGRIILANIENCLAKALGQDPIVSLDVHTDQNVELVATLFEDAHAGRDSAYPASLVLPPGVVEDSLRWLRDWPKLDPEGAFTWLGLSSESGWEAIVKATYARFENHWAAGVAYHH
jgi:hypothetical protein